MTSLPPEDLLPVLVADLADDESREVLEAAAFTGSRVYIPLETAPVSASQHVLEVHLPGSPEPILFLALPLGPPTEDGFPLRVQTMRDAAKDASPRKETPSPGPSVLRSRRSTTSLRLTASHAADLASLQPPAMIEDPLLGRALAGGKLKIENLIGKGGVGAVYKARHRELKMPVAVKVLHESFQHDIDFCRRFYAEALAASRLDHPNITRVIDFGQEPDGLLYFAMEFLAGVELRAVLEKDRVLPPTRIAEVMMQVCAGLSQAHKRGIVHRDVKPENLVLVPGQDDDGRPIELVKVCDFGIAQHRALNPAAGQIAGTPEYMSPEQCRGDELDARSDVYACGIILYELATGQVPFLSERPQSILNKQQFTDPLAPSKINPDVDPLLEKIILKALAKDPVDRQQGMRELRAELRELLSPILVEASPPPQSVRDPSGVSNLAPQTPQQPFAPVGANPGAEDPASGTQRRAAEAPAWLERGPVYGSSMGPSSTAATAPAMSAAASTSGQYHAFGQQGGALVHDEVADAIAFDPAGWLRSYVKTPDPRVFSQLAQRLEPALRTLAARGDARTLWMVSSTLHGVSMEGTQAVGSRAQTASRVLRVFDDPAILSAVAEQLLTGGEEARDYARRLLLHAGVAGAYGLYGARVKLASEQAIRGPFVTVLKDFGGKAWPVVRAALEKIIATGDQSRATMELAEDLLLCVPIVGDESAGHLAVKYMRVNVSGVCRAATASVVKLWSERSKPLLVGMLQSKDDVVRIAGIAGLRQINGIDEHVVPRLHGILTRRIPAGEDLRAAAAVALSHATPTARQPAVSVLAALVTPARDAPATAATATPGVLSREDAVVVASARSLLAVGGKPYRGLVAERAERSAEPLRSQLRRLLTG
jgi:serine/threonine-protein kinase